MSASHLRAFCLLASCFIHWLLLGLNWGPAASLTPGFSRIPFESAGAARTARTGFALQQLADQAADPVENAGTDRRKEVLAQYLMKVKTEINRRKFLGAGMNRQQMIGNVEYAFDIDAMGIFHGVRLTRSSGSGLMDRAAGAAIRLASHRVKRPKVTGSRTLSLRVTVKYQYGL